jgi:hypothetical protein
MQSRTITSVAVPSCHEVTCLTRLGIQGSPRQWDYQ